MRNSSPKKLYPFDKLRTSVMSEESGHCVNMVYGLSESSENSMPDLDVCIGFTFCSAFVSLVVISVFAHML